MLNANLRSRFVVFMKMEIGMPFKVVDTKLEKKIKKFHTNEDHKATNMEIKCLRTSIGLGVGECLWEMENEASTYARYFLKPTAQQKLATCKVHWIYIIWS